MPDPEIVPEIAPTVPPIPGAPGKPVNAVAVNPSTIDSLIGVFTGKSKALTQWGFGAILSFGALMQVQEVRNFVLPLITTHPRISSLVASLTGLATLLHNPQVAKIMHIKGDQ